MGLDGGKMEPFDGAASLLFKIWLSFSRETDWKKEASLFFFHNEPKRTKKKKAL